MDEEQVSLDSVATYIDAYRSVDKQVRDWIAMRETLRRHIEEALGEVPVGERRVGTVAGVPTVRYSRYEMRRLSTELARKKFGDDALADCFTVSQQGRFMLERDA